MANPVIVAHYHELWAQGPQNRLQFFTRKLATATAAKRLQGIPVEKIEQPGHRFLVRFGEGASLETAIERIQRVFGIVNFGIVRASVERDIDAICKASPWEEVAPLQFSSFAVRRETQRQIIWSRRDGRSSSKIGRYLLDKLRGGGRTMWRAFAGRSGADLPHRNHTQGPRSFMRGSVPAPADCRRKPAGE